MKRVVSGGQTGVDRAALDAARALGIACGGWCPAGRWAEDGPIGPDYPLDETPEPDPAQRTGWNVRDADATLIVVRGPLTGGTAETRRVAERLGRPVRIVELSAGGDPDPGETAYWIATGRDRIDVLNVAGPRESEAPGIEARARAWLERVFERVRE